MDRFSGAARPYLSLVVPTRNDDYPSNVAGIQGKSLSILQRQLEDARLESEILVIEYNPDPRQPGLSQTLRVDAGSYVTVKVISVDPKYHRRFRHWEQRVFHQTLAVNAGLRRSRGHFFVYRAADHIYSDALIKLLSAKTLRENTIYRCDRVNIDRAAFDAVSADHLDQISGICNQRAIARMDPLEFEPSYRLPALHTHACGDFLLMARDLWMRIAGLREGKYPVFLDYDSLAYHAAYALCRDETVLPLDCCVYKLDHAMKFIGRLQPVWSPRWARLDRNLLEKGAGYANVARALFNYPRRVDRTFPGVLLDSFERHFVLPAFLWSRGFPVVRQNFGAWGLRRAPLAEVVLARAAWDCDSLS
jgi:hypothetical protein